MNTIKIISWMTWFRMDWQGNFKPAFPQVFGKNHQIFKLINFVNGAK